MTELRQSTVILEGGHEYYHGDLPGTLQYSKKPEELKAIPNILHRDTDCGYVQVRAAPEYLNRFIPNTKTGRAAQWELMNVFQRTIQEDGEIWMKAALRNKSTGDIALMTCTNAKENITRRGNRCIESCESGWFIGHYRMAAPMIFWQALVAAL